MHNRKHTRAVVYCGVVKILSGHSACKERAPIGFDMLLAIRDLGDGFEEAWARLTREMHRDVLGVGLLVSQVARPFQAPCLGCTSLVRVLHHELLV